MPPSSSILPVRGRETSRKSSLPYETVVQFLFACFFYFIFRLKESCFYWKGTLFFQRQLSDQLKRRLSNHLSSRKGNEASTEDLFAIEKLQGSLLCLTRLWYELPTPPILHLHCTPPQTVKIKWSLVLPQKRRYQVEVWRRMKIEKITAV